MVDIKEEQTKNQFRKNKYGIPELALQKIKKRDTICVYCRKVMTNAAVNNWNGDRATIEHLNHLPPWDNPNTVAICCWSCNASRGKKTLPEWFKTKYCLDRNISEKTVAQPVRDYLVNMGA
jgi:hypothetical protein